MLIRVLLIFIFSFLGGKAAADGLQTWMTIDEWGNQSFVFLDKLGRLNISCNLQKNSFFQVSDLKDIIYISNNSLLLSDGSVWVVYMAQNDNLDRSIKNDILNMKGGGFGKELECFGYNIPKNIYLKKVIKNGVKKIVGTPAFVLALTDDGRILGFGAQESWGFGVPTYKNITDGAGEWIWNHESDDSMTVEDDMRLGFMGSAFRNIFGEIYVKDFNGLDEEVIDIAASTSIFGAITKSGKIYVWGQKDRYGISSQSSEENISNTILYKILHSISCPTRLFFGKQYIYVVDCIGAIWMWGGIENKIYDFPHSIDEPEVFKPGQITSKKPVMAPISLEFDGRSKISSAVPPLELYSPVYYFDEDILKIGYMFGNFSSYGRWLNEIPYDTGNIISDYVERNIPFRKFYQQYDSVVVDVSALKGRKIKSLDPFPMGYFPQYLLPTPGIVIDEDDNLYQFSPERHTENYSGDEFFLAGRDRDKQNFYLPYPRLVEMPIKTWPVSAVIQE